MNLFKTPLFSNIKKALFLRRLNRFVIECNLDGQTVVAHLPNPGRLWELLLPNVTILLVKNRLSPLRTTSYTAVAVIRDGVPVLLHTQMTNTVVQFLLGQGRLPGFEGTRIIRREAVFGKSRFDFLLQRDRDQMILEVKSCTLFNHEMAMFPDAVSDRARRHLMELAEWTARGYSCGVVFVVSAPEPRFFLPDYHTDFAFARALQETKDCLLIKAVGVHWRDNLTLADNIRDIPIPWPILDRECRDGGAYILILRLPEDRTITIGSMGNLFFPKGYYLYTGSARKNLAKRLERHIRKRKNLFWHIDYLREAADHCLALPFRTEDDLEHDLAEAMSRITPRSVPRFGASDCHCASHLFAMDENPIHHPAFIDLLLHFRMDRLQLFGIDNYKSLC